jgi:hypothetical protein
MIAPVIEKINLNDVIETDDDTLEEDQGEEGPYPYDPTEADIDIREDPQTVFELMRKYDNGKLIIEPDFQRNLVWERTQQSKFIESVILNFPIPPFYVNQTREGKYMVVCNGNEFHDWFDVTRITDNKQFGDFAEKLSLNACKQEVRASSSEVVCTGNNFHDRLSFKTCLRLSNTR